VEQGVTNEAFPNPRETASGATGWGIRKTVPICHGRKRDVEQFALFMKLCAATP